VLCAGGTIVTRTTYDPNSLLLHTDTGIKVHSVLSWIYDIFIMVLDGEV
jgi:hypothetical protein